MFWLKHYDHSEWLVQTWSKDQTVTQARPPGRRSRIFNKKNLSGQLRNWVNGFILFAEKVLSWGQQNVVKMATLLKLLENLAIQLYLFSVVENRISQSLFIKPHGTILCCILDCYTYWQINREEYWQSVVATVSFSASWPNDAALLCRWRRPRLPGGRGPRVHPPPLPAAS